jgi:hypothetical protein
MFRLERLDWTAVRVSRGRSDEWKQGVLFVQVQMSLAMPSWSGKISVGLQNLWVVLWGFYSGGEVEDKE